MRRTSDKEPAKSRPVVAEPPGVELVATLLGDGEPIALPISGYSMSPCLRPGDVVVLAPIGGRPPRQGELVAFARGRRMVVHRVIGRRGDNVLTRGDAVARADGETPMGELVGRVMRVERDRRRRRLGLGPERRLIAWLSRRGWLLPVLAPLRRLKRRLGPDGRFPTSRG